MILIFFIHDLNDNNATNRSCFVHALNWRLFKLFKFERVSAKDWMDSIEYGDDKRNLGSDLRLADDAYKLPTTHAPTMR